MGKARKPKPGQREFEHACKQLGLTPGKVRVLAERMGAGRDYWSLFKLVKHFAAEVR